MNNNIYETRKPNLTGIGFDVHGTIQKHPDVFKPLMKSLYDLNYLYIISGPPYDEIKRDLTNAGYKQGVHYHRILSVVDWLKTSGAKMTQNERGSWETDDQQWWSSKGFMCVEHDVGILYDDQIRYYMNGDVFNDGRALFFHVK